MVKFSALDSLKSGVKGFHFSSFYQDGIQQSSSPVHCNSILLEGSQLWPPFCFLVSAERLLMESTLTPFQQGKEVALLWGVSRVSSHCLQVWGEMGTLLAFEVSCVPRPAAAPPVLRDFS